MHSHSIWELAGGGAGTNPWISTVIMDTLGFLGNIFLQNQQTTEDTQHDSPTPAFKIVPNNHCLLKSWG